MSVAIIVKMAHMLNRMVESDKNSVKWFARPVKSRYSNAGRYKTLLPNKDLPDTLLVADSPATDLDGDASPSWTITSHTTNNRFIAFIMVKPDYFSEYEGVWCPLKALEWSWGGVVVYNTTTQAWTKKEETVFVHSPTPLKNFFPQWSHKAESGGEPTWRNK